jgi:hypothetical protein
VQYLKEKGISKEGPKPDEDPIYLELVQDLENSKLYQEYLKNEDEPLSVQEWREAFLLSGEDPSSETQDGQNGPSAVIAASPAGPSNSTKGKDPKVSLPPQLAPAPVKGPQGIILPGQGPKGVTTANTTRDRVEPVRKDVSSGKTPSAGNPSKDALLASSALQPTRTSWADEVAESNLDVGAGPAGPRQQLLPALPSKDPILGQSGIPTGALGLYSHPKINTDHKGMW